MDKPDNTQLRVPPTGSTTSERIELSNEWHARPDIILPAPFRCTHLMSLRAGNTAEASHQELVELCATYGQSQPAPGSRYHILEAGSCLIKWESHTEATSHTILVAGNGQPPFGESAIDFIDPAWRETLLGDMFVGVQVEVFKPDDPEDPHGYERAKSLLGASVVYGGWMAGRKAAAWSAFRLDARGFVRLVIVDHGMEEEQLARLLHRLLDMETYRMLAMKALPPAREVMSTLQELEPQLDTVMRDLAEHNDGPAREHALSQITGIAARVEQLASAHAARFGGARAYAGIVERRAEEVREEILDNHQRYTNFLLRALVPAMRTCDAAERRTHELAERVARAANLLTTMVDMEQTRQSHGILESLADRAHLQLRLQQAVEGFSIFAISYYAVGLIKYTLEAAHGLGLPVDSSIVAGASAPIVFALVFLSVRAVRRRLARGDGH
jgi:uncharacterized membrane-anchored protein